MQGRRGLERELGAKVSGQRISLLIISSIKCPLFRRKTPRIFRRRKNSGESDAIGLAGGPQMNRPWRMGRKGKEECGRTRRTRRRTGKKKEGGMEDKKDDKEEKEELPGGPK